MLFNSSILDSKFISHFSNMENLMLEVYFVSLILYLIFYKFNIMRKIILILVSIYDVLTLGIIDRGEHLILLFDAVTNIITLFCMFKNEKNLPRVFLIFKLSVMGVVFLFLLLFFLISSGVPSGIG